MIKCLSYKPIEYISAILFFFSIWPSFLWNINRFIIYVPLFLVLLFHLDMKKHKNSVLFPLFFIILCIIPVMKEMNLNGFIGYTMFAVVPFIKKEYALRTFQIFRFILAFVTGVSILMWIIVVVLGVDLPHTIIVPLNTLKTYNYLSYPFLLVSNMLGNPLSAYRFCCIFDEPGVVGTYSLLILYIEEFNYKQWYNIVYLIAGFFSFSLFFYIGLILFILFRVFTIESQKKYRYWAIAGVLLLFLGIQKIPVLNDMVGIRLEYDMKQGKFVGDNRNNEEVVDYIESIRGTHAYYWGDTQENIEYFNRHASIRNAILRYGMVFIVLFFIFFFLYAKSILKRNNKEIFLFMLLVFLTLYQRPGFVNPVYLFLFSTVIFSRKVDFNYERIIERKVR